jgi:2-dehydro-3-deoxyglucarate aldolase
MDLGAYGVIVPNIKTSEEAKKAVESVRYPPYGKRGVGLFRAQQFGKNFENYKQWLKNESVVIIQIEHIDAVNNINEIFSVKGIDAFMIGPYDLSGSVNKTGKLNDPVVKSLIQKILKAGKKHSITAGIHSVSSNPKDAIKYKKLGFKFLAISLDSIFLIDKAVKTLEEVRKK